MKPYADNIVTFGMLLRGYAQAFERLSLATRERDEVTTFVPLFEALNWAVALDDRCAQHWAPEGEPLGFAWRDRVTGAEVMRGVRWARNGVHHQWSDALVVEEDRQYPKRYPVAYRSASEHGYGHRLGRAIRCSLATSTGDDGRSPRARQRSSRPCSDVAPLKAARLRPHGKPRGLRSRRALLK